MRTSTILAAFAIVLLVWYPFVTNDIFLYTKPILAILIASLVFALCLLAWYKLMQDRIKVKIRNELYEEYGKATKLRIAPTDIINSLGIYNSMATTNYWVHRTLGIIGLASSLFLAVAIGQESIVPVYITKLLAFISSFSTGVIFSFNLVEKSNRARKAFRHLLNAIMLYQHEQISMAELLKSYNEAENYLGDDEFRQTATTGNSARS
jgi:hypothetical protein